MAICERKFTPQASLALAATLALAGAAQAGQLRVQEPRSGDDRRTDEPLRLQRLTAPVKLDGLSDEPAWRQVPPLRMTTYTPRFSSEQSERTEIRIGYDDRFCTRRDASTTRTPRRFT